MILKLLIFVVIVVGLRFVSKSYLGLKKISLNVFLYEI